MKYIKKFENSNNPEVDDYVILDLVESDKKYQNLYDFINTNIGRIIRMNNNYINIVVYENIPENIGKFLSYQGDGRYSYIARMHDIAEFAKTKEELEIKLSAKKYNL